MKCDPIISLKLQLAIHDITVSLLDTKLTISHLYFSIPICQLLVFSRHFNISNIFVSNSCFGKWETKCLSSDIDFLLSLLSSIINRDWWEDLAMEDRKKEKVDINRQRGRPLMTSRKCWPLAPSSRFLFLRPNYFRHEILDPLSHKTLTSFMDNP